MNAPVSTLESPADGFMGTIASIRLLRCWRDVLDRRTRMFAPSELRLMDRAGLGDSGGILE